MLSAPRPAKVGKWTEPALRVLRERYLARENNEMIETPEEMCWRVAQCLAQAEERWGKSRGAVQEIATAFYDLMVESYFLPNSPTLMNAGRGNQLQYSACYVLPVGDSMGEIFDAVKAAAIIHKSGGGCIAGDARVWTTFCGLEPIEVLVNRAIVDGRPAVRQGAGFVYDVNDLEISTISMDPETGESGLRRVTHVWRFDVPAEQQVLVETREGVRVQTSAWHPFMVVRPEGLRAVRADALAPGDVILGLERPDAYWPFQACRHVGGLVIDELLGWLVGFTLGDGSFGYVPALRQHRLRWFSGERDVLERVRSVLDRQGIQVAVQQDARGLLSVATLTQRFVLDMLEVCGLEKIGPKDDRVRIPEVIMKSPLSVIRAFVAGLLDSDGYVARDGSPSYTTASLQMADDLAGLMSLLGYQPSVGAKAPHGKGKRTVYTVQLCTLPQVNDLRADLIPFVASQRRIARLRSASRRRTALRLPFRLWRHQMKALGVVLPGSRKGAGPCAPEFNRWSCNAMGRCRRDDLSRIADAAAPHHRNLANLLHRVASYGMEILAVHPAQEPKPYYDLTVEGWNTYAAGMRGMAMVHNTGFAFSRLRPKDDLVASTGGKASGPVSFLRVFNGATEAVKQGGTRRGANMGILRVDHPDILEFIDSKLDGGITNFNISVAVTDRFMEALARDEEYELVNPHTGAVVGRLPAREVNDRIVKAAWRTGDPGMVFIDRINRSRANPTPEVGMVEATNPCGEQPLLPNEACFAPETRITTDRGLETVADLYHRQEAGEAIVVATNLNGRGKHIVFRPAVVVKTGVKSTVRVTLANGQQIRVTADHKMLTESGWKEAGALAREDRVCIQTAMAGPLHITNSDGDLQRMLGWLTGDGWFTESVGLTFGPEDELAFQRLVPVWRQFTGSSAKAQTQATMVRCIATERAAAIAAFEAYGFTPARGPEKRVPKYVFTAPKEEQLRYLQGLFCADGSKTHRKPQVTFSSASLELLRDVQLLLVNLGTRSNIKYYSHRPTGRAWGQLKVNGESYHRFLDLVGFPLTPRKQERCEEFPWQRVKKDRLAVPVASVVSAGEVEVYDISEAVTHSLIAEGMIVHNCNLGSINVSKFAKLAPNGEWTIDWEELERVVRLSVRFLDDVIEMNPYPLPEIDETVKANRRIGLGVMGWADLLFAMGIPYDSQEALDLADQLMAFIEEKGHDQSARLAEERGPFPNWNRSIYKNDRPLRNSTITTIAPTGTISMIAGCSSGIEPIFALAFEHRVKQPDGERVLTFVNETFERIAREQGFYSEALMQEVVRRGTLHGIPGVDTRVFKTSHEIPYEWHVRHQAAYQAHTDNGVSKCVTGDTLIFTGQGILRIQDLYGGEATDAFRPIQLRVADWTGSVEADLFYFGGKRAVIALEAGLGFSLRATPNHRVRVMANGEVVWRRMDEIKVGDFLVVPFGFDIYGHMHDFKAIYGSSYRPAKRTNAKRLQWPYKITRDLARLLGYLIADGGFNENQVMFTQKDEGVIEDYRRIIQRRFGVEPRVGLDLRRENLKQAVVNSRDLIAFFSDYLGTGDRADTKHTPRCILASGPEVMKEYVRGLTLDGYVSKRRRLIVLGTVSRRLAEEVQAILLNLGIVARLETKGISYEYRHEENRKEVCYEVVVLPRFQRAFLERIGFAEARKNAVAREQLQRRRQPDTHSVVPGVRPMAVRLARAKMVEASSEKLRDYLHSFITADAEVTEETIRWLLDITRELKETSGWKALASVVNQKVIYTPITKLWSDKEEVFDLQIPSTHSFVTNGLISHNTINVPNTATEEDIASAYLLAWELGCLGITIFRDGCKGDQVLNVGVKKEDAPAAAGRAQVMIKPRPHSLAGHTYRMETPVGTAFITVNDTAEGDPFEVFVSVGKAGSDTMAVAEALGRLISLILRLPSPLSPQRRLEAVIGQLSRIGGGQPMGFGASKVLSLPDALGRLLGEHIGVTSLEGGESTGTEPRRIGDLCKECGQATFIYEEGCKKCLSCGYNEC